MADIGILMSVSANDDSGVASTGVAERIEAIKDGLGQPGQGNALIAPTQFARQNPWDPPNYNTPASNLVNLNPPPQAIFSSCYPTMSALASLTQRIPIVYAGLFNSDAANRRANVPSPYYFGHPNVTGFVSHEFNVCRKWPIFLKTIAPGVTYAAVIYESTTGGNRQYQEISANPNGVQICPIDLAAINSSQALDAAVALFVQQAAGASCGLIVTTGALTASLVDTIIQIAHNRSLPAIYPNRLYAARGGLISYGADLLNLYTRAGVYLGRILNGATLPDYTNLPAVLPPPDPDMSDFELAINRTTATSLGNVINAQNLRMLLAQANWVYN